MLKQMTPEQRQGALNNLWAILNIPEEQVLLTFRKFWYVAPKDNKKLKAIELLARSTSPEEVDSILKTLQLSHLERPGITYERIVDYERESGLPLTSDRRPIQDCLRK